MDSAKRLLSEAERPWAVIALYNDYKAKLLAYQKKLSEKTSK